MQNLFLTFISVSFRWVYPSGPNRHQCRLRDRWWPTLPGVTAGYFPWDWRPLALLGHVTGPAGERGLWDCGHPGRNGGGNWYGMGSSRISVFFSCLAWVNQNVSITSYTQIEIASVLYNGVDTYSEMLVCFWLNAV